MWREKDKDETFEVLDEGFADTTKTSWTFLP